MTADETKLLPQSWALPISAGDDTKHLQHIDGLRGLAALYVVSYHAWLQTWPVFQGAAWPTGLTRFLTGWLMQGEQAVTFFIAVSGFCLMLPILRNNGTQGPAGVLGFFKRRARRILPPYYAALVFSVLLAIGCLSPQAITAQGLIAHLLLVHNLHTSTMLQINGPMWSVAVECQIYLLFPVLVLLRRTLGTYAVLGITYIVSVGLHAVVTDTPQKGLMPSYLFVFALGMYGAELATKPRKRSILALGGFSAMAAMVLILFPRFRCLMDLDIPVGICSMCILVICSQWKTVMRIPSWRPLVKLGAFSYSLYLFHFPIQQILWKYLLPRMGMGQTATFAIGATLGTALVLALTYTFYLLFERPFSRSPRSAPSGRRGGLPIVIVVPVPVFGPDVAAS
jgi:peptidoglycan/LPS O-acetylase OafA/YrhL